MNLEELKGMSEAKLKDCIGSPNETEAIEELMWRYWEWEAEEAEETESSLFAISIDSHYEDECF
jgi:hypothetical protein